MLEVVLFKSSSESERLQPRDDTVSGNLASASCCLRVGSGGSVSGKLQAPKYSYPASPYASRPENGLFGSTALCQGLTEACVPKKS